MEQFVGSKVINAKPMTRLEYNNFRGWDLPKDEDGTDEGFLVEYVDGGTPNVEGFTGYVSWSPMKVFINAYSTSGEMSFGDAVLMARSGNKVYRKGWNGSGMFAYIVPANSYLAQTNMIKGTFPDDMVPYREYWALKTAQNDVAMWSPSGSDSLANDWCVGEPVESTPYSRVQDEYSTLSTKSEKLADFLYTDLFHATIPEGQQQLMIDQLRNMVSYMKILSKRMELMETV